MAPSSIILTVAFLVNSCNTESFLYFYSQLRHYLQHNFGQPYDENYYNGDWMMGPNYFCWQSFCSIHIQLFSYGSLKSPSTYKSMEEVILMIMKHKTSIDRYRYCFYFKPLCLIVACNRISNFSL